jgi:hypothetical protein
VTKVLVFLLMLLMLAHIIKPIGFPGLRRRADFWKIALVAIVAMGIAVLLQF